MAREMEPEMAEEKSNREARKYSDDFDLELEEIEKLFKEQFLNAISIIGDV